MRSGTGSTGDGAFSRIEVVEAGRVRHGTSSVILTSELIDLAMRRQLQAYDKRSNRALVRQVKGIVFGNECMRLTQVRCEAFFVDPANFG